MATLLASMMNLPTPQLQLETLFCLNSRGRIISTREPHPSRGPRFILVRGASACAWAIRDDVDDDVAAALDALAAEEVPSIAWDQELIGAQRYHELLSGPFRGGPAFVFPDDVDAADDSNVAEINDEASLNHLFSGWIPGEIAAGRAPVMAISENDHPISICFSARRSDVAAEAGVETATAFRGRGYAPRVTAAWARAVRALGLTPIYSTYWNNHASLPVARKLRLIPFASDWSID